MTKFRYTDNQKKAHDIERHISVTAGAGSGKTAVLVNRYLKILIEKKVRVRDIVAITFTDKAAAEMKSRVSKKIDEMIEQGKEDLKKLRSIKEQLTSANISTIHSFCSRILREFPVEARVDAGFRIIKGIERRMQIDDVIDATLKEVASRDKNDSQRKNLADLLRIIGQEKLKKWFALWARRRYELELLKSELYSRSDAELLQVWHSLVWDLFCQSIGQTRLNKFVDAINRLLPIAKAKKAARVPDLVDRLQNATGFSQMSAANELTNAVTTKSHTIAKQNFIGRGVDTSGLEAEIKFICDLAKDLRSLPTIGQDDELLIEVTKWLLELYDLVIENYEKAKIQSGQLDFADLQLKVKKLLEDASIRKRLAEKYPYIMIDEFQDTNKLQFDILKPLVEDYRSGNLFIVGDPKQSIYGFRNADVRVFDRTKREITEYQKDLSDDFVWEDTTISSEENEALGELFLSDSFRSLRDIVGFVNLVFEDVMGKKKASEFEVDYEPLIKGRQNEDNGTVELILHQQSEEEGEQEVDVAFGRESRGFSSEARERATSEFEIIAERIKKLIVKEHQIWEREDGEEIARAVKFQDIAILLRNRTRLPELELALDSAGIPFQITGGIGFYQHQEIYDIYNYLQFLLNPHDDIALAGILRGPFFGISDAELYEIADEGVKGSTRQRRKLWMEAGESRHLRDPLASGMHAQMHPQLMHPQLSPLRRVDPLRRVHSCGCIMGQDLWSKFTAYSEEFVSSDTICGGNQHSEEFVSSDTICGGNQHSEEFVSSDTICGGNQHSEEFVSSDTICGGNQHRVFRPVVATSKRENETIRNPKSEIERAHEILSYHLQIADRVPVPVLIRDIFDRTGAIGVISAGPKGDQTLGNYEKLLGIARDFERSGFSNLFDFVERLKILIDEEKREEQANIQLDRDAVAIMTVHAAKGLEFPVVILPATHKKFNYDRKPFIDDAWGVGFSPADPKNNYRKSEPGITKFTKGRAKSKRNAEEKRIFYVAATRARDMLIISGEFPKLTSKSPTWMKWVCEALEIYSIPDTPEIQRAVSIMTLDQTEGRSERVEQDFQLTIKVIRSMSDLGEYPELQEEEFKPRKSLEINIEPIAVDPSDEIFSVSQLITYPLCPRRFYLQHRLGMPESQKAGKLETQHAGTHTQSSIHQGEIVHEILEQIRSPHLDKLHKIPSCATGNTTLERMLKRYGKGQEGRGLGKKDLRDLSRHIENFIKSNTGRRALSAEKQYHETTINARLGKHLLTGKIDLLFVNKGGQHEIVDYKTDFVTQATVEDKVKEYRSQMDLYAWLVHKCTKQSELALTIFFTDLPYAREIHYDRCSLEKIEPALKETINQIEARIWDGNPEHCPDCPYCAEECCMDEL